MHDAFMRQRVTRMNFPVDPQNCFFITFSIEQYE